MPINPHQRECLRHLWIPAIEALASLHHLNPAYRVNRGMHMMELWHVGTSTPKIPTPTKPTEEPWFGIHQLWQPNHRSDDGSMETICSRSDREGGKNPIPSNNDVQAYSRLRTNKDEHHDEGYREDL